MGGLDHAIIVGITRYGAFPQLNGCENDAKAFADWLARLDGGGVPGTNIRLFLSSNYPPAPVPYRSKPMTSDLDEAFDQVIEDGRAAQKEGGRLGRLYIYMAGHGLGPDVDEAALLMANADAELRITQHLAGRAYAKWFIAAGYFTEIVLLVDCCRDAFLNTPLREAPWAPTQTPAPLTRHTYGFATRWGSKARERPDAKGEWRGWFSRAVMLALEGHANPGGAITSSQLEDFVHAYLAQKLGGDRAEPTFEYDKKRQITLVSRAPQVTTPVEIRFTPPESGTVELLDGAMNPVRSQQAPGPLWKLDVPSGAQYAVRRSAETPLTLFTACGETVTVDADA